MSQSQPSPPAVSRGHKSQGDESQGDESHGDESQPLLFVYGSLKRGQRAHHLLRELPWLGQAWLPGACLHDLGPFPMAVLGEGRIQGELYGVCETVLAALDRYEGAPRLYQRHWLNLEDGRGAWVYLGRPHQVRHVAPLASGCWLGPSGPKLRGGREAATAKARIPAAATARARAKAPLTTTFAALTQALSLALVMTGGLRPGWAFDTLGACQSWQNSRGQARIEVANSIGAAHYLTKIKRLQESDPAAPVPLYSESDIARVCSER